MDYLKKILPAGSTVFVVVCEMTNGGTRKVKYLSVNNGMPEDITHQIARTLEMERRYDEKLGRIITTDPDNIVATLALKLYDDHKALTPKRL